MGRSLAVTGVLLGVCGMALSASPVLAEDSPDAQVWKQEISDMKGRLGTLEDRLAKSEASSAGAEEGNAVLQLPSGLHGVQMSGFVDTTFTYNLNEPQTNVNSLRVFDTRSNGFMINNAQLTVSKPVDASSPVGFMTELMFGTDAEVVGSVTGGLGVTTNEIELQEAFVEYLAPIGNGLDLRVGKFATMHGAEVIESKDNWNISRSFLFGFAIPFTHTGFRAMYPWTEQLSTTVGVSNGWDLVDDTNKAKTVEFNVMATPVDGVMLSSTYMFGAEQAFNNDNQRHLIDIVLGVQPIEGLELKLNYDYGFEDDGASAQTPGDNAVWHGLAGYAKYALSERASVAVRGEFMNDVDGIRTAFTGGINGVTDDDIKLYGLTLTGEYKINDHLISRLEYRHDKANARIFRSDNLGLRSYQDTIALEFIAPF